MDSQSGSPTYKQIKSMFLRFKTAYGGHSNFLKFFESQSPSIQNEINSRSSRENLDKIMTLHYITPPASQCLEPFGSFPVWMDGGPATLPQYKCCPQGSCTDPAYWNFVANEILSNIWPQRIHLQAFADDSIFLIEADTKAKVEQLANQALSIFKACTDPQQLQFSTEKSSYFHFNKNRNGPAGPQGSDGVYHIPHTKLNYKISRHSN
ncbi:hypothetical protein AVEN_94269-1 [Araneus ventricosus]|uniref:Reverse transcriptase domain-containing protein n=1 Tax=Araneus ventricosus TaxID=182803 RepID=A0A4Y2PWA5_ARAVE|nr:hypothetical protein AVEN_94269-1 [Araneus ventricosus]